MSAEPVNAEQAPDEARPRQVNPGHRLTAEDRLKGSRSAVQKRRERAAERAKRVGWTAQDYLREKLEERATEVVSALVAKAEEGDVNAVKLLLDRAYGPVTQRVEDVTPQSIEAVKALPRAEKQRMLAELLKLERTDVSEPRLTSTLLYHLTGPRAQKKDSALTRAHAREDTPSTASDAP